MQKQRIIDATANFSPHPELGLYKYLGIEGGKALDPAKYLETMDKAGVEITGLVAGSVAIGVGGEVHSTDPDVIAKAIDDHPGRYFGWIGIDPLDTMPTLKRIEYAVTQLDFRAVHVYPHWFGVPINDRLYYPIYAKCAELGIPIGLQVGSQSMRSGGRCVAQPILLDDVAFHFPGLQILGLHIGTPWAHEMAMICRNHENVHMVADAHPPTQWEQDVIDYVQQKEWTNKDGSSKVIWGTDWPVQDPSDSLAEVRSLGFTPEVEAKLIGENAVKMFRL